MKICIFIGLAAFIAVASGVFVPPRPGYNRKIHLLGANECTWGPSYWCQNLTTSAACHATKHCIQTVWIHKQLPPDESSICQTCKDMVKQARDQLMSNETQELIKEVFEGSCALLRIKPIVKECDNIADNYIPELVDTLASEMNPQVVCSVAGLCNSEKIHRLIAESEKTPIKRNVCMDCHIVTNLMENKFHGMTRDDVLNGFLHVCGKLSSLSDACSNIVITYFTEIYQHIYNNFNADDVCVLAGECSARFHTHAKVEITTLSKVGYLTPKDGDDLPCELCEQLVTHLRELLVANTTESEFKTVLRGLCKQTKSFADECLSIVDQYYDIIYMFLTQELKPKEVCSLIGICPNNKEGMAIMAPLVPIETENKPIGDPIDEVPIMPIGNSQLPIELLMPPHTQNLYNKEVCIFCEYFLHFIQQQISDPKNEEEVRRVMDQACNRLPKSVNKTCVEFVNMYEPAVIAILAQEIDPSQVCPLIKACPGASSQDVEIFMQQGNESPNCPLCLFAVSKLEKMVANQKTKENIKNVLNSLCTHLPNDMNAECKDFVQTYTDELVEMLMADLSPSEVCVYIKLCDDSPAPKKDPMQPIIDFDATFGGDIKTNIIPDDTINGEHVDDSKPQCVLCEFVMKEIEDQLKDKKTDDEIKQTVLGICKILPSSIKKECTDFINQNADTIIALLVEALEPSQICRMMKMCQAQMMNILKGEILECAVCEGIVQAMKKILANPRTDHSIEHVLEKSCRALPKKFRGKCDHIIQKYGVQIFKAIVNKEMNPRKICKSVELCAEDGSIDLCNFGPSYFCANPAIAQQCVATEYCEKHYWPQNPVKIQALGVDKCTWGPGYWCQTKDTAQECKAENHCEEKVWSLRPKRDLGKLPQLGVNNCTWGPDFLCANLQNAVACNVVKLCEEKVWSQRQKRSANPEQKLVGKEKCTWGPGYWCTTQQTAEECNALEHCNKVWSQKQKRSVNPEQKLVGKEKCTWGPGYWCTTQQTAEECNALEHCNKVWSQKQKRSPLPEPQVIAGKEKCTRGPGYWCQTQQTAEECNALEHCRKVWFKS